MQSKVVHSVAYFLTFAGETGSGKLGSPSILSFLHCCSKFVSRREGEKGKLTPGDQAICGRGGGGPRPGKEGKAQRQESEQEAGGFFSLSPRAAIRARWHVPFSP